MSRSLYSFNTITLVTLSMFVLLGMGSQPTYSAESLTSERTTTLDTKSDLLAKKDLKTFNITLNPAFLPLGIFEGEFDVGISDKISLGIYSATSQFNDWWGKNSFTSVGGRMHYYLSNHRFLSGWYLSPFTQVLMSKSSAASMSIGGIGGYQWVFKHGFNMMLGLGAQYFTSRSFYSDSPGIWPTGEFRIGFAF